MKADTPMEGIIPRRIALRIIRQVTEEGAYASLALDNALKGSGLKNPDRRLVSRLVYDTLDHLVYLDYMLSKVMARDDTDIKLRNILRLGACQILIEDRIPESAATNLSVQLCAETGMPGLKGVCNGILRNLIRKKDEIKLPDPFIEPVQYASVRYSIPEWLYVRLKEDYGEEAEKILSFRQTDEGWLLRPNLTRTDDQGFEEILNGRSGNRKKQTCPMPGELPGRWISAGMQIT